MNDETLEALCKQSINQARAGCHIIAPSDMMDGRIGAIREALDIEGFQDVSMAYSAKTPVFTVHLEMPLVQKFTWRGDKQPIK